MWTSHNPYTTDKRFHHKPPTPKEIQEGLQWIRERRTYIKQFMTQKPVQKF